MQHATWFPHGFPFLQDWEGEYLEIKQVSCKQWKDLDSTISPLLQMCLAAWQTGQYLTLADLEKNILYEDTLLLLGKECP